MGPLLSYFHVVDFPFGGMLTFCQSIIRGGPYKETVPNKILKYVHVQSLQSYQIHSHQTS